MAAQAKAQWYISPKINGTWLAVKRKFSVVPQKFKDFSGAINNNGADASIRELCAIRSQKSDGRILQNPEGTGNIKARRREQIILIRPVVNRQ